MLPLTRLPPSSPGAGDRVGHAKRTHGKRLPDTVARGRAAMSFGLYMLGVLILVGALAYGASRLGVWA